MFPSSFKTQSHADSNHGVTEGHVALKQFYNVFFCFWLQLSAVKTMEDSKSKNIKGESPYVYAGKQFQTNQI